MDRKGSVLIAALWILIVLAFLGTAMGVRTQLEAKMSGIQLTVQNQRQVLESGIQIGRYLIETDADANEDNPLDQWYGDHDLGRFIPAEGYRLNITDEESKININRTSAALLRTFFELLERKGHELETDPEDLAASIARWRGDTPIFGSPSTYRQKMQPFESLPELLLIEHITDRDYRTVSPYFTVYGRQGEMTLRINVNTASEEVLEAVVLSLTGDELTKKQLAEALMGFRRQQTSREAPVYFQLQDLATDQILQHLKLSGTIVMLSLINQLLPFLGVDSSFFSLSVHKADARYQPSLVSAVVGPTGSRATPLAPTQMTVFGPVFFRTDQLDILSWQEGV